MQNSAGDKWRELLNAWAIPQEILDQAPENPWIHPPVLFQIPEKIEDSISHRRAREAIPQGGSVLDVGCGGGIAAFAVTPPAGVVFGVDHQLEMLEMFAENARERDLVCDTYEGFWPEIEARVPIADVAVAHHVVYNVAKIEDFILKMNAHAKERVVLELPQLHPLTTATPLWKRFWNLDRPVEPTPSALMDVLESLHIDAHLELWDGSMRGETDLVSQAHFSRIRLCLPESREPEVLEFLREQPKVSLRNLATIWWDVK